MATGFDHDPYLPDWPGTESFTGDLIHASEYVDPTPYQGKDVLVVGPGVTGTEVAFHLVEGGAARVRVSSRTPPHFYQTQVARASRCRSSASRSTTCRCAWPTRWPGRPSAGSSVTWLRTGCRARRSVRRPSWRSTSRRRPATTVSWRPLKAGRITVVPAVEGFDGADILLADGSRIQADVRHRGHRLSPRARPAGRATSACSTIATPRSPMASPLPNAPGLYFAGFRGDLSGQLRLMKFHARSIAKAFTNGR